MWKIEKNGAKKRQKGKIPRSVDGILCKDNSKVCK
jgi:hypothetical protein